MMDAVRELYWASYVPTFDHLVVRIFLLAANDSVDAPHTTIFAFWFPYNTVDDEKLKVRSRTMRRGENVVL